MSYSLAVDMEIIQTLRDLPAGGERLLDRLVDVYLADTPETIAELRQAIDDNAVEAARFAAHSLKSSSANLGAHRLSSLAASVEQKARGGSLAGCDKLLAEIDEAFAAVHHELRNL